MVAERVAWRTREQALDDATVILLRRTTPHRVLLVHDRDRRPAYPPREEEGWRRTPYLLQHPRAWLASCAQCDVEYWTERGDQLYCSTNCRVKAHLTRKLAKHHRVCPHCGAAFTTTNARQVYCTWRHGNAAGEKRRRARKRAVAS
jgi:hypothetical protein